VDGLFELHPRIHLQQDNAQAPHVHGGGAAGVPLGLHPGQGQAVLELCLRGTIPVCLDILHILVEEGSCGSRSWDWSVNRKAHAGHVTEFRT